jgi:hypothetical protein
MSELTFTPGTIVRVGAWVGVILDTFISPTTNQTILQINFVKNIYKQQPPELHLLENLQGLMNVATIDDFETEAKRYEEMKEKELDALRAKTKVAI